MQKFLRLEFIASSPDAGLLLLRLWLGGSMLWLHGWDKLMNLFAGKLSFLDPLGIGEVPSFLLTVLAPRWVARCCSCSGCGRAGRR